MIHGDTIGRTHGILPADYPLTCYSLTGYSGGGKKLIAEYEASDRDKRHESHRIYGTNLRHKHLPEIVSVCGLAAPPVFSPILGDFYCGMATTVMLHNALLRGGANAQTIYDMLCEHYGGHRIKSSGIMYGFEFMKDLFLRFILWEGDDEFPANMQILFSRNFPDTFSAEDRVVVCEYLIGRMQSLRI